LIGKVARRGEGGNMNLEEIRDLLLQVEFSNYEFLVGETNGVMYLQARYLEADIITGDEEWQTTRKWQLSPHMVKSEIVQTAFKCALTSAEHRVREHFLYKGKRIFGPHFDVDALVQICEEKRLDYRRDA
jgi:hypothetical protein